MAVSQTRKFSRRALMSALSIALSGTAAADGTIDWDGQVELNAAPLDHTLLHPTPSGMTLSTDGELHIGVGSTGRMRINGANAVWNHSGGEMFIGGTSSSDAGQGQLLIDAGAQLTQTSGDVTIGYVRSDFAGTAAASGKVKISGAGSVLRIDGGDLRIGIAGSHDTDLRGELTIADQARVLVNATQDKLSGGEVVLGSGSGKGAGGAQNATLRISGGGVLSAKTVGGAPSSQNTIVFDGGTLALTNDAINHNIFSGIDVIRLGRAGATIDIQDPNAEYNWDRWSDQVTDDNSKTGSLSGGLTKQAKDDCAF